jgi:hypothetical protein
MTDPTARNQTERRASGLAVAVGRTNRFDKMIRIPYSNQSVTSMGSLKTFFVITDHDDPTGPNVHRVLGSSTVDSTTVQLLLDQGRSDRERISALEREVAELRESIGVSELPARKVSRAQCKKEICAYFETHHGETFYPSDLADELRLDYGTVRDIIDELETEGEIAKA